MPARCAASEPTTVHAIGAKQKESQAMHLLPVRMSLRLVAGVLWPDAWPAAAGGMPIIDG